MSDLIQKKTQTMAQKPNKTIKDYVKSMEGEIAKALPSVITPERFTRMVTTAISSTPKLAECTPTSFLGAMMQAAQLGLEPNTPLGQAYLIPRKNSAKNEMECVFELGYKGLIDLAYRSGEISVIQAQTVYENDIFECEYGLEPKLTHIPREDAEGNRGKAVKYYAMFRTKDGGFGFEVMSANDIRAHAKKYSQSYASSYSPWNTSFDEMAKKTVLKRVLKYAPLKSDFARKLTSDETVKTTINQDMFEVADESGIIMTDENGEVIENAE